MSVVTEGKKPVLVNSDCSMVYLIVLSFLLIKCFLSPKKVPIKAATGLWEKTKGGAGLAGIENNEPAGPETKTENEQTRKTLDSCICNHQ